MIAMPVILNHLTIMGVATCNIAQRPELTDSRTVLLVMNRTGLRNLNTKRIDDAYAKLHRSLRRQMFRQAGIVRSSAQGILQMRFQAGEQMSPVVVEGCFRAPKASAEIDARAPRIVTFHWGGWQGGLAPSFLRGAQREHRRHPHDQELLTGKALGPEINGR